MYRRMVYLHPHHKGRMFDTALPVSIMPSVTTMLTAQQVADLTAFLNAQK
jgi:hypothetical protein